ncbi:hypothetical protein [Streptomyces roseifaciens]|uniref:hypothetical protein n=1 Tax=Streptomyces roseifaciens TaxID=1488406 RepID=UPI000AF327B9|nr:hypothetical protein [Streptomyces roseifaciens]
MSDKPTVDRFDYTVNLERAGSYRMRRSALWPPSGSYALGCLDLAGATPDLGDGFRRALAALKGAVEAEWHTVKEIGIPARRRFNDPPAVAGALRDVAEYLPGEADRRAAELRADAVRNGYDDGILKELASLEEEVTIVAGQISTWYGKDVRGLPTAFACRTDGARQELVGQALALRDEAAGYLHRLHSGLRLGELPAFGAAELFFMAGEGNLHPKHIAYFLPEDEGVKYSPFKKTYYFANTHRALLETISAPLAARHVEAGPRFAPADERFATIPVLGVLGHELGHFVHRTATDFTDLNAEDRWASVVLQEVAADVFGTLILADVWAPRLGIAAEDCVAYYLAECLRYLDRGLGHFPDSDGMFLQLSYFVQLGALEADPDGAPRLKGDPGAVLAGLRSLARVLADTLLATDAGRAVRLHRTFGPATASPLSFLIDELRGQPLPSVEYMQEHLHFAATPAS